MRASALRDRPWMAVVLVRALLGLVIDIFGLLAAWRADNAGDVYPFGIVTISIFASGLIGYWAAYSADKAASKRKSKSRAVLVWLGSAPEALYLVPAILLIPVVGVASGTGVAGILYSWTVALAGSAGMAIQGLAVWWWRRN